MKKFLLRSQAIVLGALLAGPALAQTGSAATSNANKPRDSQAKAEVSLTRAEDPGLAPALAQARSELEAAQRRGLDEKNPEFSMQRARVESLENAEKNQPWLISIEFPGGTISKFLTTISTARAVSFNIIGAGDRADFNVEVPPFTLRNAHLDTVFKVLRSMLAARGFELEHAGGGNNSLIGVLRRIEPAQAVQRVTPAQFDSFLLAPYLADQSVDDIVSAIRVAWELDPTHDRDVLRLKFHPATSILLVSGPPEAIMVARKVISQLTISPDKGLRPNKRPTQPPTEQKR
ncbi:MAG: hypothetical protein HY736_10080 [Verrucomicrobia bacterium]|nr:hypothetical protein [Verrucomicrobiota bacterium]